MKSVRVAATTLMLPLILAAAASAEVSTDPAANFVTKLFIDACVPNMEQPANIRSWAKDHHLNQISDPAPLAVFVGPGDRGAAWAIPAASGNYALSIRGTPAARAVWAQEADPDKVTKLFKMPIEGVARPALTIAVYEDSVSPSPFGRVHTLSYNIMRAGAQRSFMFTMHTTEHAGGPFQTSILVGVASDHP